MHTSVPGAMYVGTRGPGNPPHNTPHRYNHDRVESPLKRLPHCNLHSSRTYPTTEVDFFFHRNVYPPPREEKLETRNGPVMRACLECEEANAATRRNTRPDPRPRECRNTRVRGGLQSRSLNAVSHEFTRKHEPTCHGTRSF